MREIKFRAWNGKKMFEVDVLAINGVSWDSGGTGVSLAYQPSIKVMQYTGLNDKSGVEIYEGDILDIFCDCDPGDFNSCNHSPEKHKVSWNSEDAAFVLIEIESETTADDFSEYLQESWNVVGNIYENPELLNV